MYLVVNVFIEILKIWKILYKYCLNYVNVIVSDNGI